VPSTGTQTPFLHAQDDLVGQLLESITMQSFLLVHISVGPAVTDPPYGSAVVFGTQVPLSHVHEVFVGHNSGSSLTQLPRLLQNAGTVTSGEVVVGSGVVVAGLVVL
jgi:hypothetical protein